MVTLKVVHFTNDYAMDFLNKNNLMIKKFT